MICFVLQNENVLKSTFKRETHCYGNQMREIIILKVLSRHTLSPTFIYYKFLLLYYNSYSFFYLLGCVIQKRTSILGFCQDG